MTPAKHAPISRRPASRLVPVEVSLETTVARLCERQPAAIVSAQLEDRSSEENQRRFSSLVRSAHGAGIAVLCLGGRWRDGDRTWQQWFLAVFGRRIFEAALRAWALLSRQEYGQEVVIVKSSQNITDLLFDSGRTERWPLFSLDLVTKARQRSQGRGALMLERVVVPAPGTLRRRHSAVAIMRNLTAPMESI